MLAKVPIKESPVYVGLIKRACTLMHTFIGFDGLVYASSDGSGETAAATAQTRQSLSSSPKLPLVISMRYTG